MRNKPTFESEDDFIAWVKQLAVQKGRGLRLGIGDDAAIVKVPPGHELILTTDMSIEDVHFSIAIHPPQAVGHRALARSLSDIAAMGGTPKYALISLVLSKSTGRAWIKGFYQGLMGLARRFDVAIIGGDTAVAPGHTMVDIMVAGECPQGKALRRSGAKPGEQIFVSGRLGLSAFGLRVLRSPALRRKPGTTAALRAHLYPYPQCALGRYLSHKGLATALMDLSDGLSTDLMRLCDASKVGARVFADRIPSPALPDSADSLHLALHGGEDYQLLFTVSPGKVSRIPRRFGQLALTCIGEIQPAPGIQLITADGKLCALKPLGFDHFARG